ncbi:hypothetical protein BO224_04425 [Erysipelotrichaceae bacterium NYU-BL-E8]|uniref:Uncharacterized protein n=1 Tax=Ileibacterium valens TaxID=1862668 RepID=A0A1U7NEB8_9FIRM|nr:hypothetical protein BM735_12890 [Erysipelotrichaceae bacterium NYU-BL-F16]OLU37903.1 hypothetical protein BO222_09320 [Ileibacterium valens]OLU40991.1 hypothetical protein BO224_04425 [Erysipelotrichaceae bacterium NYU-BL-E8]
MIGFNFLHHSFHCNQFFGALASDDLLCKISAKPAIIPALFLNVLCIASFHPVEFETFLLIV